MDTKLLLLLTILITMPMIFIIAGRKRVRAELTDYIDINIKELENLNSILSGMKKDKYIEELKADCIKNVDTLNKVKKYSTISGMIWMLIISSIGLQEMRGIVLSLNRK